MSATIIDTSQQSTEDEKRRQKLDNALRDFKQANESEFRSIMEIVFAHNQSVSRLILAIAHDSGIDSATRRDFIHRALNSVQATRSWLTTALGAIDRCGPFGDIEDEPPF